MFQVYLYLLLFLLFLLGIIIYWQCFTTGFTATSGILTLSQMVIANKPLVMYNETPSQSPISRSLNICLVSGSVSPPKKPPREYATISRHRLEEYANRHGYHVAYFENYINQQAPPIWQKVYAVQQALLSTSPLYDVVVWIDDDIYITDLDVKIEKFLALSERPIIMSEDMRGPSFNFINTGAYILRNTPECHDFINDTILGREGLYDGYWNQAFFHEQSVMTYLLLSKYKQHGHVLKKGLLQSFYHDRSWQPGDFCLHLAGVKVGPRLTLMQRLVRGDNPYDH